MTVKINLRQIAYFVEVARYGATNRAAEVLNVSQPAVTRTIKELEAALGLQLFTRSRNGMTLTDYGRAFLKHATAAMAAMNSGLSELESLKHSEEGQVTVGGLQIIMSQVVPKAVARVKRRRPLLNVTIIPGTHEQLIPALKVGELDIIFGRKGDPEQMTGLFFEPLFRDRLVLISRRDHPLAGTKDVSFARLAEYPWVIPLPHTAIRECLTKVLHAHAAGFPPNCVETAFGPFTRTYMDETEAVVAVPDNIVRDDLRAGKVALLMSSEKWVISDVGIIHRENPLLSEPARMMIQELHRAAAQIRRRRRRPRGANAP